MRWTVICNDDYTVKNVKPGSKLGRPCKIQFAVEAPNFAEAWRQGEAQAKEQKARLKPCLPPPKERAYRHPAFMTRRSALRVLPPLSLPPLATMMKTKEPEPRFCRCDAPLGSGEDECAICRHLARLWAQGDREAPTEVPVRKSGPNDAHLRILLEIQEKWLSSPNVGKFSRWLTEEIDRVKRAEFEDPVTLEPAVAR